jgi:hypothetical protein
MAQLFPVTACRVAVIDSGVDPGHPYVGNILGGVEILRDGSQTDNYADWLGHGTAVAATIHEKAPAAGILVVKIFHRSLSASIDQFIAALEWALDNCADVINLSTGTTNPKHRELLEPSIQRAIRAGSRIVSTRLTSGVSSYPGCMSGVVGVEADSLLSRGQVRFDEDNAIASPYPRPIPDLPPERSLSSVSFAVANVSGYLCAQLANQTATH